MSDSDLMSALRAGTVRIVPLDEFADFEEEGAEAMLGSADSALIGEGGDVMFYGDGGAGKTTLTIDLAWHLAAGDDWLGIPVPNPLRVLLVENEGPRPFFRHKLKRKRDGWQGSPLEDRIRVFEEPWARFSFADPSWRDLLAGEIRDSEVDVVVVGPIASAGMEAAGTLQEVREFVALVDDVRDLSGRRVAMILVHHEAKGGKVSGAWEGVGDTLFHVQAHGHGRTRLYVQKARWASDRHATALELVWAAGEGFELADKPPPRPERTWDDIETYVLEHGGCGWNEVDAAVEGRSDYLRRRRDMMLDAGVLLNVGAGQKFELWHRDDPARPTLDTTASGAGRGRDAVASAPGDGAATDPEPATASPRPPLRDAGRGTRPGSTSPADPDGTAEGSVVNLRSGQPYDVRIDRETRWGNPFAIPNDGDRETVIAKYRAYLEAEVAAGRVTLADLAALHGKRLGCWCAPEPCHGDVLVEAAARAHAELEPVEAGGEEKS